MLIARPVAIYITYAVTIEAKPRGVWD